MKDEKIYHSIAVYDDLNGLYDKFVGRKFVERHVISSSITAAA